MVNFNTIDEYNEQFPDEIKEKLTEIRNTIKEMAPDAIEKISYQMPTFYYYGNLVHFAVSKNHYGFYPTASGIENFKEDLKQFKYSKGAIQFPKDAPLPIDLIKKIVQFRLIENKAKFDSKKKK